MTGISGYFSFILVNKSKPEPLGMRISLTMTCGNSVSSFASASAVLEKVLNFKSERASAFSNTQRIDLSSSIIQIGFIYVYFAYNYCLIMARLMAVFSTGSRMVKQVLLGWLLQSIMP